jgi:Lar family restriction alleviation protein
MGTNIGPCPFCGNTDCVIDKTRFHHHVTCLKCEAKGPLSDSVEEAIAEWNKADSKEEKK